MGACVPPPGPDGGAGGGGAGGGAAGAGGGGAGGGAAGTGGGAAGGVGSGGAAGGVGGGGAGKGGAAGAAGGGTGGGAAGTAGAGAGASGAGGTTGGACAGHAFCDDFEDGDAAGWTSIGGTWSVVADGSSVYRGANGNGNAIAGSAAWTDQTVEARVKVVQFANPKANSRGGVIARYANATTFYVFMVDATGGLRLLQNTDVPGSHTGTCQKVDANVTEGSWHTLKLSVSGSNSVRLQTFMDGAPIHDCTSTAGTVPAGSAGAYVYGSNTIVEFDDVKVSTP
jgi:pectate lyase